MHPYPENNVYDHNFRTPHPNIFIGLNFSLRLNQQHRHFHTTSSGVKSVIRLTPGLAYINPHKRQGFAFLVWEILF